MTLPAHRYLEREERAKPDDGPKVWVFDFDETITTAPEQLARIAAAVRALGDKVYVLTGNQSPRAELLKRLTDDYKFPFDDLIQYQDEGTNGLRRAAYLKRLDAWCCIDDRVTRSYTYAQVCPHLFLVAKPSDENKDGAKGAKKQAKQALKNVSGRSGSPGQAVPSPGTPGQPDTP